MATRNIVLTERHQKTIERLVATGRYQNASEVLREGLRLLEQREAEDEAEARRANVPPRKPVLRNSTPGGMTNSARRT